MQGVVFSCSRIASTPFYVSIKCFDGRRKKFRPDLVAQEEGEYLRNYRRILMITNVAESERSSGQQVVVNL